MHNVEQLAEQINFGECTRVDLHVREIFNAHLGSYHRCAVKLVQLGHCHMFETSYLGNPQVVLSNFPSAVNCLTLYNKITHSFPSMYGSRLALPTNRSIHEFYKVFLELV